MYKCRWFESLEGLIDVGFFPIFSVGGICCYPGWETCIIVDSFFLKVW